MQWLREFFSSNLRIWPVVLIVAGLIGGLVYLVASLPLMSSSPRIVNAPFAVSPVATLDGTPIAPFSQINPAIVNVLNFAPTNFGAQALDIYSVQPVGAYLPRSGELNFSIIEPTAIPSPFPFPTAAPLPLTPDAIGVLPTLIPNDRRIVAYGGDACAPAGRPVEGVLTQRYHAYHGGIDIGVPFNTPVIATHSGTITYADWSAIGYGYLVVIENEPFTTYYAHNTSFNVRQGQQVGKGTVIAWSGSTGNSTGPHVHYETRIDNITVDPATFESRGHRSC